MQKKIKCDALSDASCVCVKNFFVIYMVAHVFEKLSEKLFSNFYLIKNRFPTKDPIQGLENFHEVQDHFLSPPLEL